MGLITVSFSKDPGAKAEVSSRGAGEGHRHLKNGSTCPEKWLQVKALKSDNMGQLLTTRVPQGKVGQLSETWDCHRSP